MPIPRIKTVEATEVSSKCVFVRVDFNIPIDPQGQVGDNTRIVAAIPTIQYLVKKGAKVILGSHLGRPKGERNEAYTLKPVAAELSRLLDQPVGFVNDCIGADVEAAVANLSNGDVLLLENLRFYKGETDNDGEFSKALAGLADIYVNDAFGTAHRAHASTYGVPSLMKEAVAGKLMARELEYLGKELESPKALFVVILGGAKVSDKINVINKLLDKADVMLIGGAMAYTFALAEGYSVGDSLVEVDKVDIAKAALEKAKDRGVRLLLPVDTLVTNKIDFKEGVLGETQIISGNIPDGWEGIDIGPDTIDLFTAELALAKTVLWNGPMGIFEIEKSATGTYAVAEAVAESDALSIIGGGDSVKAINQSGYSDKVTFMSTGGGASLQFLEGKELPGVEALDKILVSST